jgi:hypothetical protein
VNHILGGRVTTFFAVCLAGGVTNAPLDQLRLRYVILREVAYRHASYVLSLAFALTTFFAVCLAGGVFGSPSTC